MNKEERMNEQRFAINDYVIVLYNNLNKIGIVTDYSGYKLIMYRIVSIDNKYLGWYGQQELKIINDNLKSFI